MTTKLMNMIKKMLGNLWVKIKKHYYLSIGAGSLILLLILISPLFHSSWLNYPESLKARIALSKLLASFETGSWCREDCALERSMYEKIITHSLSIKPDTLLPYLEKEILDSDLDEEVRAVLLKMYLTTNVPISEKLKNYYTNASNDFKIRAQLAATWPEIGSKSMPAEIIGRYKNSRKIAEKINLLKLLKGQSDPLSLSLLWEIILSNDEEDLKNIAFSLLSNIEDKKSAYNLNDLDKLKIVLQNVDYPPRLKDQAIYLLNNYYEYYPEQSELLLLDVVVNNSFDNYQKAFAINILNSKKMSDLKMPDLSQADWDSYYNN